MEKGLVQHKLNDLTEQIIKAFYTVYNTLGYGFLEKVYITALLIELEKMGILAQHQGPILVYYDGKIIGEYFADIVVQECIIIEVKAVRNVLMEHEAQLLNYLKASKLEVGLLLNFGPKPEVKRKIFDNDKK